MSALDVELQPCPTGGLHRITSRMVGIADGGLITYCAGCRETWAELDAALRAQVVVAMHKRHKNAPRPNVGRRKAS